MHSYEHLLIQFLVYIKHISSTFSHRTIVRVRKAGIITNHCMPEIVQVCALSIAAKINDF